MSCSADACYASMSRIRRGHFFVRQFLPAALPHLATLSPVLLSLYIDPIPSELCSSVILTVCGSGTWTLIPSMILQVALECHESFPTQLPLFFLSPLSSLLSFLCLCLCFYFEIFITSYLGLTVISLWLVSCVVYIGYGQEQQTTRQVFETFHESNRQLK